MNKPTDAELTEVYKTANGELTGKSQPLTTQRIFRAMRAAIAKWGQPQAVAGVEPMPMPDLTQLTERGAEAWAGVDAHALRVGREPRCWCLTCRPMRMDDPHSIRMALCPTCGNKRCPKANDHRNACTNSNEPGQPGSAYPGGITKGGQHGAE